VAGHCGDAAIEGIEGRGPGVARSTSFPNFVFSMRGKPYRVFKKVNSSALIEAMTRDCSLFTADSGLRSLSVCHLAIWCAECALPSENEPYSAAFDAEPIDFMTQISNTLVYFVELMNSWSIKKCFTVVKMFID
jgi:hypothetical protein